MKKASAASTRNKGKQEASPVPHYPEAEKVVLGAILLNESREQLQEIGQQLHPDDFFLPSHQMIFRSLLALAKQGATIHVSALKTELMRANQWEAIGGASALGSLIDGVPFSTDLSFEVQQIKDAAAKRKIQSIANKALNAASNGHSSTEVLGELESDIRRIKSDTTNDHWIGDYRASTNGLERRKSERHGGKVIIPLCNFTAKIISDVIEDDGAETQRCYEIETRLAGEHLSRKGLVKASDFAAMKWPDELLGARQVIYPQQNNYACCAIKLLSDDIKTKTIYTHTGWREIEGGQCYLHGGGAIGASGLIEAEVRLPLSLSSFHLPSPPTGKALTEAISATLSLLDVAPGEIIIPLVGAIIASVLTGADFSVQVTGYTGAGKSQLAALAQSFFGSGFDASKIPASWSSSANSLEGIAHTAKDTILVVDDFCPTGSANEVAKLHATAERVFRAQGNHSGRGRMRADGSLRAVKPPRGLIISTGEDIPKGQSLRARLLILEIEQGAIQWDVLTRCQKDARAGRYAQSMSAFLQWLATDERIRQIQAQQHEKHQIHYWREQWLERGIDGHKRSATTLAYLARAWHVWIEFAKSNNALTAPQAVQLWKRVWTALGNIGQKQNSYQISENPALRFIELVQSAFASGRAYLDAVSGGPPEDSDSYGWRGGFAQGERIGWLAKDGIYLIPDAAYTVAQKAGEGLAITQATLWKRLKEGGFVISGGADGKDERIKSRKMVNGTVHRIIHLKLPKREAEKSENALA